MPVNETTAKKQQINTNKAKQNTNNATVQQTFSVVYVLSCDHSNGSLVLSWGGVYCAIQGDSNVLICGIDPYV